MSKKNIETEVEQLLSKYKLDNSEHSKTRIPLQRELELLNLVKQGRYREIIVSDFSELAPNLGRLAQNIKKNYEYYAVSAIAVCSRHAIEGGMPPDDAFDLSDVLLQKLEKVKNIEEIQEIFKLAFVAFSKGVYEARRRTNSYVIEQCKTYISKNIFQKIVISEIADYVGLSEKYISKIFAEKEHITLYQYIQREKIRVSCNLLRYSKEPVSMIAQYIGFQSQSNFSAVFRKWEGMSPSVYRNQFYKENYSE